MKERRFSENDRNWQLLKIQAAREGVGVQALVRRVTRIYVDKQGTKELLPETATSSPG